MMSSFFSKLMSGQGNQEAGTGHAIPVMHQTWQMLLTPAYLFVTVTRNDYAKHSLISMFTCKLAE